MKICLECQTVITSRTAKKFCCQGCASTYNNRGVRRHGQPKGTCIQCSNEKSSVRRKFCSSKCSGDARRKYTAEQREIIERTQTRHRSARYRASLINQTPDDADLDLIKDIYKNCPKGYEVDHIFPISKGGLHHQNNLQYLTVNENRSKGNKVLTKKADDANIK